MVQEEKRESVEWLDVNPPANYVSYKPLWDAGETGRKPVLRGMGFQPMIPAKRPAQPQRAGSPFYVAWASSP